MVYTTWAQGFREAHTATTASLKLETSLPHTLQNLSQRIFPSYAASATLWSNLLSSGLAPPPTNIQQLAADGSATKQEAMKKWRMCLERADLVKKKVIGMGGQVGKPVDLCLRDGSREVGSTTKGGEDDVVQRRIRQRTRQDDADQVSILRRSSTIQRRSDHPISGCPRHTASTRQPSLRLPLWHDGDATFITPLPATQIEDMILPPELSPDQQAAHATWENMYTPCNPFVDFSPCAPSPRGTHTSEGMIKVEQGIGANCSVIAGLNGLVAHNLRWGTALGVRNFVPIRVKGRKGDEPRGDQMSEVRYWRVKVFVNGAWRSLVIDSRLPVSKTTTQSLHAVTIPIHDSNTEHHPSALTSLAWLPLLEKAYMALIGSYAFPGSTPATDIHALTSWIPEQISLSGARFQRERTWTRITDGWRRGTLLVTLGTGSHVGRNAVHDPRVVPLHAYAVVDVREETELRPDGAEAQVRSVRVLNPWKRGRTRMDDGRAWTRDMLESLVEEAEDEEADDPPDIWWMNWDEACNTFDTLNLNWDPRIFENSETVHSVYNGQNSNEPISVSVAAPSSGSDVWILLQRHLTSFAAFSDTAGGAVETPDGQLIKMAIEVLESSWEGSVRSEGALESGMSLQNKCLTDKATLLIRPRFERSEDAANAEEITYSIAVYSDANIRLDPRSVSYPYEKTINLDFAGRTAGGNSSLPTYMYNPQYRIEIKQDPSRADRKTPIGIKCTLTGEEKTSYNLKLVWYQGQRVTELESQDIIVDSGEYRYAHVSCTKSDITAGVYTLVASTFEPGKVSAASIKIQSTSPLDITPVPQEGAGMFNRTIKGQWSASTAAGRPSLGSYDSNPRYELLLPEPATVFCRLQLATASPTSIPISIAIFRRGQSGSLKDQVSTSGPYADPISGVVTPHTYLEPGLYVLVPSTYAAGVEKSFVLSVYATRRLELSLI